MQLYWITDKTICIAEKPLLYFGAPRIILGQTYWSFTSPRPMLVIHVRWGITGQHACRIIIGGASKYIEHCLELNRPLLVLGSFLAG